MTRITLEDGFIIFMNVQGAAAGGRTNQRLNDMPVRAILNEMYSPKLVIKQIFTERKWATFYRLELSPICLGKQSYTTLLCSYQQLLMKRT